MAPKHDFILKSYTVPNQNAAIRIHTEDDKKFRTAYNQGIKEFGISPLGQPTTTFELVGNNDGKPQSIKACSSYELPGSGAKATLRRCNFFRVTPTSPYIQYSNNDLSSVANAIKIAENPAGTSRSSRATSAK